MTCACKQCTSTPPDDVAAPADQQAAIIERLRTVRAFRLGAEAHKNGQPRDMPVADIYFANDPVRSMNQTFIDAWYRGWDSLNKETAR